MKQTTHNNALVLRNTAATYTGPIKLEAFGSFYRSKSYRFQNVEVHRFFIQQFPIVENEN